MSNTAKHILYAVSNISLSREQLVISTSLHMHVEAITAMYDFAIGNLAIIVSEVPINFNDREQQLSSLSLEIIISAAMCLALLDKQRLKLELYAAWQTLIYMFKDGRISSFLLFEYTVRAIIHY
jgi:hypothetical protein